MLFINSITGVRDHVMKTAEHTIVGIMVNNTILSNSSWIIQETFEHFTIMSQEPHTSVLQYTSI